MTGNRITCPVCRYAGETPGNPAVIAGRKTYTYLQLHRLVSGYSVEFLEKGIGEGVRTGLVMDNGVELIARLCAAWRIGVVAVPFSTRLPMPYLETLFRRLDIENVYWREDGIPVEGVEFSADVFLDRDATVILTSGSTGVEKAVLHTYGNHYYNALGSNENIPVEPGDRWLLSLPLYHVGGLGILFRTLLKGAAMVIPGENETIPGAAGKYGVTHMSLVSTQLYRLLENLETTAPGGRLSPLKAVLLGGGAFPEASIDKALSLGLPVYRSYGLSEMASQVTTTPPGASRDVLFTSGKRLNYRDIEISPDGEILVSGLTRFKGYAGGGPVLDRPFDEAGRFATGDLGRIDENGNLHVLGRKDNMFISGGENIMPEEIETHLDRLPGVEQSVVAPVADKEFGFRPVAFLKFLSPGALIRDKVMGVLQERLPRFKIPDEFYPWPEEEGEREGSLKIKRSYFIELAKKRDRLTLLFKK
jgi:O-succinylbenzoic acid--CoA ligase